MVTDMDVGVGVVHDEVAHPHPRQAPLPRFLGQSKAEWYIYWICAVASIANMYGTIGIIIAPWKRH